MRIFEKEDVRTLSDLWTVLKFVLCWPVMLFVPTKKGTRNKRRKR